MVRRLELAKWATVLIALPVGIGLALWDQLWSRR